MRAVFRRLGNQHTSPKLPDDEHRGYSGKYLEKKFFEEVFDHVQEKVPSNRLRFYFFATF